MAKKTIVDKAGETVGVGIAMASDVAGAIKTAVGGAMTAVSEILKKEPATKTAKPAAKTAVVKKAAKKPPAKKVSAKKNAKPAAGRKTAPKKVAKKSVKKTTKKAGRRQR